MMDDAANLRRGVLIPSIAAASAFAVLLSLGLWQLDRKAWKEGLIATIERRLSAPPVALPGPAAWPRLGAAEDEFRRLARTARLRVRSTWLACCVGRSRRAYSHPQAIRPATSGFPVTPTRSQPPRASASRPSIWNWKAPIRRAASLRPDACIRPCRITTSATP